jgi:hypothetical protein
MLLLGPPVSPSPTTESESGPSGRLDAVEPQGPDGVRLSARTTKAELIERLLRSEPSPCDVPQHSVAKAQAACVRPLTASEPVWLGERKRERRGDKVGEVERGRAARSAAADGFAEVRLVLNGANAENGSTAIAIA